MAERVRAAGYGSQLYAYSLKGRVPDELACTPEDIWPGDPAIGNALFQGRFAFAGKELVAPGEAPWGLEPVSEPWAAELNGFAWLRHLGACAGPTAQRYARELVRSWIGEASAWDQVSWRPDVLGRRLVSWLSHAGFLLDDADNVFRTAFLASLAEQARHLSRTALHGTDGAPRLAAAVALAVSSLCLAGGDRRRQRALRHLAQELGRQILRDGGHIGRSPSDQLAVLRDLIVLRGTLLAARHEVPQELHDAIERMARVLRFFRHGDGGLALFNGATEESAELVDITLARAAAARQRLEAAPASGFQRLVAGRTVVLVDTGQPPPAGFDGEAHAGTLSFELSVAAERLIVNCGSGRDRGPDWARAARTTAAHSTLAIANTSSSELKPDGRLGRRPQHLPCSRREQEGNIWLETSHDGYERPFGLVHRRRLYLDASGEEIRGEDAITGPGVGLSAGLAFAVRFHLHADVRASLAQNGAQAWLRLASGAGWRLRAAGGALSLEESVYLGGGALRRSEQIVISGSLERREVTIKWALSRVPGGS